MHTLPTVDRIADATADDPLMIWAAQGMRPGVGAWAEGGSVAVARPALNRRDRIAVIGRPAEVAALVEHALAERGPSFRPIGDAELIKEVVRMVPGLDVVGEFGWMDSSPGRPVAIAADAAG